MFLRIDNVAFDFSQMEPFTFKGVLSGKELRGMELVFTSHSQSESEQIETLIKKKGTVVVSDPAGSQYKGKIDRQWSNIHQGGRTARRYQFTIREIDQAKPFDSLRIEGNTFTVLRNAETTTSGGEVGIHVLLRLSPEEFATFLPLLKPGPVQILRVGVDENPVERRFGAIIDWSYHKDDSGDYYKQAVNFYDVELSPSGLDLARGQEHRALSEMVVALTVRFHALLDALVDGGLINAEQATTIRQEQWRDLADEHHRYMIWAQTNKVEDAEEDFEGYEQDDF